MLLSVCFCWLRKLNLLLNKHILEVHTIPQRVQTLNCCYPMRSAHKLVFSKTSQLKSWQVITLNFMELNFGVNKYILKWLFSQINYFFHFSGFFWYIFFFFFLIIKSDVLWYDCVALWVIEQSDSVRPLRLCSWNLKGTWWMCMFNSKFWRREKRGKQWISVCTCFNVLNQLGKGWRKGKTSDVISS